MLTFAVHPHKKQVDWILFYFIKGERVSGNIINIRPSEALRCFHYYRYHGENVTGKRARAVVVCTVEGSWMMDKLLGVNVAAKK